MSGLSSHVSSKRTSSIILQQSIILSLYPAMYFFKATKSTRYYVFACLYSIPLAYKLHEGGDFSLFMTVISETRTSA